MWLYIPFNSMCILFFSLRLFLFPILAWWENAVMWRIMTVASTQVTLKHVSKNLKTWCHSNGCRPQRIYVVCQFHQPTLHTCVMLPGYCFSMTPVWIQIKTNDVAYGIELPCVFSMDPISALPFSKVIWRNAKSYLYRNIGWVVVGIIGSLR